MTNLKNKEYTPATIDICFKIPLYQRLFEWDKKQVIQLLRDLLENYKKTPESPYYIGMLTTFKENKEESYSLVDGQQRFTVLTLIGTVLGWNDFLEAGEKLRLSFFARKKDEEYLRHVISKNEKVPSFENYKMKAAIDCINEFLNDKDESFKKYIFEKTTFFISELPETYNLQDLNLYFERMNEAGKGLENHEILKVRMLNLSSKEKYNEYTTLWNAVCEMDKCVIRQKENEKQEDYKRKNLEVFRETTFEKVFEKVDTNSKIATKSLMNIELSQKKPSESFQERNEKAILTFTDFLLQVLWLCLEKESRKNATEFFNRNKLLETFEKYFNNSSTGQKVSVDIFFNSLLKYRILFDYYIIRLNSSDERNVTYTLNHVGENSKTNLIQYQSMIHVSTETHIWLTPFLIELKNQKENTTEYALKFLQNWDNKRLINSNISLNYSSINRYWFWRLDYYLWLLRNEYFEESDKKEIADKYVFRSNRSIEHIAPQNPKSDSQVRLDEKYLHLFGNLAMISSGQNSSLQNESYEVKRAYVYSFINKSVGGSIQSLKMLDIYQYNTWDETNIKVHHNKMLDVLIDSFENKEENFEIRESLKSQKLELLNSEN